MPRPDFDVVVAGAGAGGAACAYHLSQASFAVLLVDKARVPRHKPCGGAIPMPALQQLPIALNGIIRAVPAAVRLTYPGLPAVDASLSDRPVAMVKRSEFDARLVAEAGAQLLDGTAITAVSEGVDGVEVEAGGRRIRARFLVGADGAASIVARRLGLRPDRQLGGTLEAEVPLEGKSVLQDRFGTRALFALGVVDGGYAWVFPKGDHLAVGIARFRTGRADLQGALRQEMGHLGIDLSGLEVHGHPIPLHRAPRRSPWGAGSRERVSTRRCLLVGDAAGLVDPLLGEGIRYALASGRLAAAAIVADRLTGYEAAIEQEMGASLAVADRVADLFYRWPRRCFQLGIRNPATIRLFVRLLTGEISYVGMGRRLAAATLSWILGGRSSG